MALNHFSARHFWAKSLSLLGHVTETAAPSAPIFQPHLEMGGGRGAAHYRREMQRRRRRRNDEALLFSGAL